jgi:hypothetical protein
MRHLRHRRFGLPWMLGLTQCPTPGVTSRNVTGARQPRALRNVTESRATVGPTGSRAVRISAGDSEGPKAVECPKALGLDVEPLAKVTDNFGNRVEVRYGEMVILGGLIEDVIAELQAKKANDR